MPSLFNPLKSNQNGTTSNKSGNSTKTKIKWNPVRKQLYDCTLLLISYFGNSPNLKVLFDVKRSLEHSDFITYYPKRDIKSINTYLQKANITYKIIIQELNESNNLREFNYDLLIKYLDKLKIKQQYFE